MSASALQTLRSFFAPSDEQLMWRVQTAEDHAAFAELVRRWQTPIHHLCTRLTGDLHRAEDLVQEIFTRLFIHRHAFRQGARLSTYLWRIALNQTYADLRRRHFSPRAPLPASSADAAGAAGGGDDQLPDDAPAPDAVASQRERAEAVRQALTDLPEHLRSVLVLRHYQDLKFREIAEILGLPEGTVKTRTTEALHALAERLRRPLDLQLPTASARRTRPARLSLL